MLVGIFNDKSFSLHLYALLTATQVPLHVFVCYSYVSNALAFILVPVCIWVLATLLLLHCPATAPTLTLYNLPQSSEESEQRVWLVLQESEWSWA